MTEPVKQMLIGGACILIGVLGWVLPYRWNPLRLKRGFARMLSEKTNLMIPKVVGSILIIAGIAIAIVTIFYGSFES